MAQEIVFYHSAMLGAPSGTLNAAGALLAVLDACLVDGFNSNSVSTLTQASGIAEATTAGTHGFSVDEWVEVAGATPAAYNGRVKITATPATNKFRYAVPGGTASPASGTMTAKYPAAGWTKTAAGTNNAAYQAGAGLGAWMQVEDNNPYADLHANFRIRSAKGWTALNTASVQLGAVSKIGKQAGGWMVFADAKTVYMYFGNIVAQTDLKIFAFGEIDPFYAADAFSVFNTRGNDLTNQTTWAENGANLNISPCHYFPHTRAAEGLASGNSSSFLRSISQIGGQAICEATALVADMRIAAGNNWLVVSQDLLLPSLADATFPISPIYMSEYTTPNLTLRGKLRGVHMPLGGLPSGFVNSYQRLDNALVNGVSQSLVVVNINYMKTGRTEVGKQLAFQVDGSWD